MKRPHHAPPTLDADRTLIQAALRGYELPPEERSARLSAAPEHVRKGIEVELQLLEHAARTWPCPLADYVEMMARPSDLDPVFQRDWWEERYLAAGVLGDFHGFLLRRGLRP